MRWNSPNSSGLRGTLFIPKSASDIPAGRPPGVTISSRSWKIYTCTLAVDGIDDDIQYGLPQQPSSLTVRHHHRQIEKGTDVENSDLRGLADVDETVFVDILFIDG